MKNTLIALIVIAIFILSVIVANKFCTTEQVYETIKIDTIFIVDTVRDTIPTVQTRYVLRTDSIIYYISDTTFVYVPIEIERKEYRTDEYYAVIDGYRASLSYIETYNKTIEITKLIRQKNKRFGLGLQLGSGYDFTIGRSATYIGVGIQYNLISF